MEYTHGGDIYRNLCELDYSININPLGMPCEAVKAAMEGIKLSSCYPDWKGEALRRAIGEAKGVDDEWILLGNGAAELIYAYAYGIKPQTAFLLKPSFQEYEASLKGIGCDIQYYSLKESNGFCIEDDFLDKVKPSTELMYICNPNNPTGKLIGIDKMEQILKHCRDNNIMLIVDECFIDFVETPEWYSMEKFLPDYSNLLILNAFTKIYAMPGLRLGYGVSSNTEVLRRMKRAMQPWNTSIPAQMAGMAALTDKEYILNTKKIIREEKWYLLGAMKSGLTCEVYGSEANFIFFKARQDLFRKLLKKGILIRDCSNFGISKGFYRIGIKTHSENQQLIENWMEIQRNMYEE